MAFLTELAQALLAVVALRAQVLIITLLAGLVMGELLARLLFFRQAEVGLRLRLARFTTKLNRPDRPIATRLWRGLVLVLMFLLPALLLGLLLQTHPLATQLVLVALFGHAFGSVRLTRFWRQAKAQGVKLELPGLDHLFADSHGVLRYHILHEGERFAIGVVGVAFWFLLGGLPLALGYLAAAFLAKHLSYLAVFGWAARALFRLVDALPRLLACLLLMLGALVVSGAKPWAIRLGGPFHGFLARLLDVSLGGTLPERELPWEGTGTPKLLSSHLSRFLLVRAAASVWLLLLLGAPEIINLLKTIL